METVLLIILIPAIVIATILYAVLAELRHDRLHRSRWELRAARARLRARPAGRSWRPAGAR